MKEIEDLKCRLIVVEQNQMNLQAQVVELQELVEFLYDQLPEILCDRLEQRMIDVAEEMLDEE